MARSRNIKPGFFTNEELVELPFHVRLLFIGLWTLADREGRLEDRPKRIKMALFPADDIDVEGSLGQLLSAGFIQRYETEGIRAIQILNFHKHQNPHVKEAASTIPAPDKHHASRADSLLLIPDSPLLIPEESAPPVPLEKKPKESTGEWIVPAHVDCPEVRDLLDQFAAMRRRIKKPIRDLNSSSLVLKRFVDRHHLIYALETCIANEYQGLKPDYRPPQSSGRSEDRVSRVATIEDMEGWRP